MVDKLASVIVQECMGHKGCFQVPRDCRKDDPTNCEAMMTHKPMKVDDTNYIKFQLYKKGFKAPNYIAMGISEDEKMGNDLVFYCFTRGKIILNIKLSS